MAVQGNVVRWGNRSWSRDGCSTVTWWRTFPPRTTTTTTTMMRTRMATTMQVQVLRTKRLGTRRRISHWPRSSMDCSKIYRSISVVIGVGSRTSSCLGRVDWLCLVLCFLTENIYFGQSIQLITGISFSLSLSLSLSLCLSLSFSQQFFAAKFDNIKPSRRITTTTTTMTMATMSTTTMVVVTRTDHRRRINVLQMVSTCSKSRTFYRWTISTSRRGSRRGGVVQVT